jgi:hypothetical protein
VTRQLVAKVVGILYLATGREVTREAIDAWAVALRDTPDCDHTVEVAAELARSVDFVTVAAFYKALRSHRRRQVGPALHVAHDDDLPLSHPAAWAAFAHGVRAEARRQGRVVNIGDQPPAGLSLSTILRDLFAITESDPA